MSQQLVESFSLESPQWQEVLSQCPGLAPFFDNLESFLDLPEGVETLRSLILDLAVRGKLVKQDSEDEPASTLLEKIEEKRQALLKAKKIRRVKVDPIKDVPFDLPPSWSWSRLAHATLKITDGTHHSPTNSDKGEFKYVTAKNIKTDGVLLSNVTFVTKEVHDEIYERCDPQLDDLLYIKDGATTGIVTINNLDEPFSMLSSVALLKRSDEIEPRFLLYVLRSPYFYNLMRADMTGVAITRVTLAKLNKALIPVAPVVEQRRIVSKVESLMSLCDTLELQLRARDSLRARASRSVLARMTAPRVHPPAVPTCAENQPTSSANERIFSSSGLHKVEKSAKVSNSEMIQSSWQRLSDHFEVLMNAPETLTHLSQSILQLAVQGKLVPQDPANESAINVIEKIAEELKLKVMAGEMKTPKILKPLDGIGKPYDLPDGWCWARFPELGIFGRGKSRHRPRNDPRLYENGKYPLVQTGDVARANGVIETHTGMYGDFGLEQSKLWPAGTMCITIAANIADTGILDFEACIPDSVVGFIPLGPFKTAKYFEFYMRTMQSSLESYAPSTAQKNINLGILETVLIPLPPMAEQKQIVTKVSVLLSQIDRASRLLKAREEKTKLLMNSLIDQILGVEREIPMPTNNVENTIAAVTVKTDSLKIAKEPASSAKEVVDLFKKKGDQTTPDHLLSASRLADDVDLFFQLLREARDSGNLEFSEGLNQLIRRIT